MDTILKQKDKLQNMDKKHIFLTGFMGAGKSKIGRLLAKRFACSFQDSDKLIEDEAGITVKEIFETRGEDVFRSLETEAINKLCGSDRRTVIALGGGANMNPRNQTLIAEHGVSVYLKSSPQSLLERVRHSDKRPLLRLESGEDFEKRLLEKIESLLDQRSPVYEKADIVFDRDGIEPDQIVEQLYHQITEFRKNR